MPTNSCCGSSTFAYLLLIDLRETRLKGNKTYAKASPRIIRDHLLKIAAMVVVGVRRVLVRWSSSFRYQSEVAECLGKLQAASSVNRPSAASSGMTIAPPPKV